jgi:hypothetical protein
MWGTNQVCGYKIMRAQSNFKTRITRKVFGVESKGTVEYEGDLKSGSREKNQVIQIWPWNKITSGI